MAHTTLSQRLIHSQEEEGGRKRRRKKEIKDFSLFFTEVHPSFKK